MQVFFKKMLIGVMLLTFLFTKVFSQDSKVVAGKISNSNGSGISGAVIRILPSRKVITSDNTGEFKITINGSDKSLEISSIGFISQTITISSLNSYNIVLKDDPNVLTDVVVTAFGIKKEIKRLGYDIQELKGADLAQSRDANPINSLVGKVAGLTVGGNAEMLGRPELVLRGSKDLLFVVDGTPINSDTWNISPDDIESYTILKGTNASAVYGFRGLNGAIVITTKSGSKDKKGWQVDFNNSTFVEPSFLTLPESQYEYGRGKVFTYSYGDRLYDNAQRLPEWGPRFEGQLIKQYNSPYDPLTGIRTATPWTAKGINNFQNFMQTGLTTNTNISMSAATDRSDIRISMSNMYQKGTAPNTNLYTYNLAIKGGYNISDKLRLEASLNLNKQNSPNIPDVNYGPNSYIYMFKVYGSSDYDINDLKDVFKGPTGVKGLMPYAQEYGRENSAVYMANYWLRTHDKTDINGYVKATYKFNSSLSLNLKSQITTWNQTRQEDVPAGANLQTYTPWWYFGWYGDYRLDKRNLFENNNDLTLNYDHRFKDWNVSGFAGISDRSFNYNSFYGTTKALAVPGLYALSNSINPALEYTWGSRMQVYSAFYSMDFTYKKFFTLSHTGRVDQLSTLPNGNNTFYYPSVSLSTVLTDYLDIPKFISFAKLRASYANVKGGLTQSNVPSAFSMISGQSINGGLLGYNSDLYSSYDGPSYNNQNAYSIATYYNGLSSVNFSNTIANPNLKPFSRTSYEGGIDLKFLKNRLGLDFTYFSSLNGPQIYALPVPSSTGYSSQNVNGITTKKDGFEISLNGSPLKSANGLNWDVMLNYSTYKETLNEIYGTEKYLTLNGHNYTVGERLDAFYSTGYVTDGKGNNIISGGLPLRAPSDIDNNKFLGFMNPDFTLAFANKFSYKNFNFSFQLDGRFGGQIYDEVYKDGMNGGTSIESATGAFGAARLAEWQSTNNSTTTVVPKYIAPGVKIVSGTPIYKNGLITNLSALTFANNDVASTVQNYLSSGLGGMTEPWMIDRTFIKLREVSFGYTMPQSMLKSKAIKSITFSLVGKNLLYFAARKDFDIEQFASGYNAGDLSLQNGGGVLQSVTSKRFGFNINVSF